MESYRQEYPDLAAELGRRVAGELPQDWNDGLRTVARDAQTTLEPLETRKSSQRCLSALAPVMPELFGGSAPEDLR